MKRRVWGQFHTIKGDDLTKIGEFYREAIEGLGGGFGQGRMGSGFRVVPGSSGSKAKLTAGWALLERADGILSLVQVPDTEVDFSGHATGTYDIVGTVGEVAETTETITPPPQTLPNGNNNPFYDARFSSYSLDVAVKQTVSLSIQNSPHTPAGAEVVIATVSWDGSTITQSDITEKVLAPSIELGPESVHGVNLHPDTAGSGLYKDTANDNLAVQVDNSSIRIDETSGLYVANVTDAMIGSRTVNDGLAPTDDIGPLTDLLSNLANRIRAITGKANWYDDPKASIEGLAAKGLNETIGGAWTFTTLPTVPLTPTADGHATSKKYVDDTVNAGSSALDSHKTATPLDHPDGSVTDPKIGNRTVDDSVAPAGNVGDLTQLLSNLANRVKAITGAPNWYGDPALSIQDIANGAAFLAQDETVTGQWDFSGYKTSIKRIRIYAIDDASPTSTAHGLQIGPDSGSNVAIDNNEIMGRNNGAASNLFLNSEGGLVRVHGSISATNTSPITVGTQGYKVWHEGNDGSGSGLDADSLDGLQGSQFLRSDASDTATGQIIFAAPDGTTLTKLLWKSSGSNSRQMNAFANDSLAGFSPVSGGSEVANGDLNFDFAASHWVFESTPYVGSNEMIHAGNIGNYSSSNADQLDGLDSTQFLRSDVDDSFTGNALTVDKILQVGQSASSGNNLKVKGGTEFQSYSGGHVYTLTVDGQGILDIAKTA